MPNIYQYDWMKIKGNFEILSHMHIHIGIKYIWNSKFWEKCVFFCPKNVIFDFFRFFSETFKLRMKNKV